METINELNERQKRILTFLLTSKSVKEAASLAGVRLATVFRWLKEPVFRAELERLREEVISDVVSRLKVQCLNASDVLVSLLGSQSESIRRGAANDIITHTQTFMNIRDIEGRLEKLEQSIKDNKGESSWLPEDNLRVLQIS